ncbi:MAG: glycosyltransferase [Candidatus Cryptobacteroides sp.]
MFRLAVIFESSPFDRKGLFNAVHQRVRHLVADGGFDVDVFCLHSRDNAFTRKVRKTPQVPVLDEVSIEGIRYRMLWYDFSVTDDILTQRLHCRPLFFSRFMARTASLLKDYDCVAAHSYEGALVAHEAWRRFGVRYYVTWHGSDIHTRPWENSHVMRMTRMLANDAVMNFYVSDSLKDIGERLAPGAPSDVLYNGVSGRFARLSDEERMDCRQRFSLPVDRKVVAYVGNFHRIKNVLSLPGIIRNIVSMYDSPVSFMIVGDGKQRKPLLDSIYDLASQMSLSVQSPWRGPEGNGGADIRFTGNLQPEMMPSLMNCIDVLLLPSLNEGCPLVCAEAIGCGAAVVGSDVCGIPDIIGKDYCVPLGDGFESGIACKVVRILKDGSTQSVPARLDWAETSRKEASFLRSLSSI